MLLSPFDGGDYQVLEEPASGAITGIRDLGLSASPVGLWSIPEIDSNVPLSLVPDSVDLQILAQFSQQLDAQGVKLACDKFTTLPAAIAQQILNTPQLRKLAPKTRLPLRTCLTVETEGEERYIYIRGLADSNLDVYLLKEPVERLNAVQEGIGWYLAEACAQSHSANLRLYEPCFIGAGAEMTYLCGASTDEEFAAMNCYQEATDQDLKDFLNEQHITFTSLAAAFGGHPHLLSQGPSPNTPTRINWDALDSKDAELLKAAKRFISRTKAVSKITAPFSHREECGDFGALGFVVWFDTDLALEVIDAIERDCYESGEGEEVIFELRTPLNDPQTWAGFITSYIAQMALYADLCNFLRHLPKKDFDA